MLEQTLATWSPKHLKCADKASEPLSWKIAQVMYLSEAIFWMARWISPQSGEEGTLSRTRTCLALADAAPFIWHHVRASELASRGADRGPKRGLSEESSLDERTRVKKKERTTTKEEEAEEEADEAEEEEEEAVVLGGNRSNRSKVLVKPIK